MTTYQESAAALATASAAAVVGAYTTLRAAGFVVVAATLVARYNVRAVALADLAFASLVRSLPLGLGRPDDDQERLLGSFTTLVDRIAEDPPEIAEAKVTRIASAEPLRAGQLAYSEALQVHASAAPVTPIEIDQKPERGIIGWRRVLNADACELCRWWYRGGYVYPPERLMRTHISCQCAQEVVFDTKEGAA